MGFFSFLGDIAETALNFIPGGSTVAKIIPGVSSLFSDIDSEAKLKEQLANQKSLMQYQNDLNLQNWRTQQEFNNYANDLQHMKAAGINPLAYGGSSPTAAVSAVSGATAPDLMSLLNYQREMKLTQSQLKTQRLEQQHQDIENKAAAAELDARRAEAEARIAEANERTKEAKNITWFNDSRDSEAYQKYVQDWNLTPPDNSHQWQSQPQDDSDFNLWYFTDSDGLNHYEVYVPNLYGLTHRSQRKLNDYQLAKLNMLNQDLNNKYQSLQNKIFEKYGDKLEAAKLNQINQIIRNAMLNGNLLELDEKWFSHLGLGPNVIRSIVSTAQAFSGDLFQIVNSASMLFGK